MRKTVQQGASQSRNALSFALEIKFLCFFCVYNVFVFFSGYPVSFKFLSKRYCSYTCIPAYLLYVSRIKISFH